MFQIKLNFSLEYNFLPRKMDRLIVSFLKASAQKTSEEFYERLYDKSKSVLKTYTFSYFLPGALYEQDKITLKENRFTMFFSDADMAETVQFFRAFQLMQNVKYPMNGNSMKLESIQIQQRQEVKDSEIVVKMLSPLLVRRHFSEDNSDIYYVYDQEGFSWAVKENLEWFLKKLEISMPLDTFSIVPVKGKKVVVDVFGRKTDGNLGIYKLTGTPELLNLVYMAGIGVRRSEGHGKFEIIG